MNMKSTGTENKTAAKKAAEEKKPAVEPKKSKMVNVKCTSSLLTAKRFEEGERYKITRAFFNAFPYNFEEIGGDND